MDFRQLVLPEQLRDEQNPSQPYGSPVVVARHVLAACADSYASEVIFALGHANAGAAGASFGFGAAMPEGADEDTCQKKSRFEHMAGVGVRTVVSAQIKTFYQLVYGVDALSNHTSTEGWHALTFGAHSFGKKLIEDFCTQVSSVLKRDPPGTNARVRLVVKDNCSYMVHTKLENCTTKGQLLHTVNWLSAPIPAAAFPTPDIRRGEWQRTDIGPFHVRERLDPQSPALRVFVEQTWAQFLKAVGRGCNVLDHPVQKSPTKATLFTYETPVIGVSTAKLSDIDTANAHIKQRWVMSTVPAVDGCVVDPTSQPPCHPPHPLLLPLPRSFSLPHLLSNIINFRKQNLLIVWVQSTVPAADA